MVIQAKKNFCGNCNFGNLLKSRKGCPFEVIHQQIDHALEIPDEDGDTDNYDQVLIENPCNPPEKITDKNAHRTINLTIQEVDDEISEVSLETLYVITALIGCEAFKPDEA